MCLGVVACHMCLGVWGNGQGSPVQVGPVQVGPVQVVGQLLPRMCMYVHRQPTTPALVDVLQVDCVCREWGVGVGQAWIVVDIQVYGW